MDKNIPLHEKIRLLRLKCNITQDVAADELHISRACLSNYERGMRLPSVETLAAMEKYYNAKPGYLFPEKVSAVPETIRMGETLYRSASGKNGGECMLNDSINISKMPFSSKIAMHNFFEYLNYCDEKNKRKEKGNKSERR